VTQAPKTATRSLERRLGDRVRILLPVWAVEAVLFVLKMGWAALFGGLLLLAIIGSKLIWQADWLIARYDALVVFAVATQALFLWKGLETWEEARVILLFHITGTAMELFKVHAGSWAYPEAVVLKLMGVPLFSGFMYASVGSFQARVIRIFEMRFAPYPPYWVTMILAVAIYVNFFAHHFIFDIRYLLIAATVILFARTRIWFRMTPSGRYYWMPLPLAAFLSSLFLWLAENIGTLTGTWLYAGQTIWERVSFAKIGSWYLLLYVALVSVTLILRSALHAKPLSRSDLK